MDIEKAKAILDKSSKFHLQVDREPNDFDIAIQTILNELDNKEKIINEMAQELIDAPIRMVKGDLFKFTNIPDTLDYFTKKVEDKND